jgi:hypothetical protein
MSFPIGTLLRFYPTEENHYTAVVCSQGVYQVKGGNKECYPNAESWCTSLPGCPDVSALHVTDPTSSAQKEICALQRAEKRALQPTRRSKLKWNVPRRHHAHRSLPWTRHIYSMIKEAAPALLQRVEICDAYNHLVNGLAGYSDCIYSYVPWYGARYRIGICIETLKDLTDTCISSPPNPPFDRATYDAACIDIMARYTAIYQYIKADVVPYMKQRDWEVRSARILKFQQGRLRTFVNRHATVTKEYERKIACLQARINHAQQAIQMASLPSEMIQ